VKALRKLAWIELKLFTRDPLSLVFTLVLPFFFLIVLNGVFGNEVETDPAEDVWRGVGPADYYVPAYLGLVMAATGVLSMPTRLASYRERGVLRRFRASAMPLWAVLGSQIVIALLTTVVGAVSITVASAAIYGTDLLPADGVSLLVAFALAALSFGALGVLLGSVMPTSRAAQGAGIMLFFVMFLLSGSGPPRDVLTGPMRAVGDLLPLTHVITLLQDPWLGFGWNTGASVVVAGVLVGSVALSVRYFRWE
jgi:ABC-2 type transport system permease protein